MAVLTAFKKGRVDKQIWRECTSWCLCDRMQALLCKFRMDCEHSDLWQMQGGLGYLTVPSDCRVVEAKETP